LGVLGAAQLGGRRAAAPCLGGGRLGGLSFCLLGCKRTHGPAGPASSADPRLCACPSPFGRAAPSSMPLVSQSAGSLVHSTWPSTPTRQASQSALPLSRVKSNQGTVLVCLSWGIFCLQSACQFGAATALTGRALCSRAAWASTGCSAACGGPLAHTSSVPLSFSATLPTWASPFAHPSPPLHPAPAAVPRGSGCGGLCALQGGTRAAGLAGCHRRLPAPARPLQPAYPSSRHSSAAGISQASSAS